MKRAATTQRTLISCYFHRHQQTSEWTSGAGDAAAEHRLRLLLLQKYLHLNVFVSMQNDVGIDCLVPACVFIQSGSQLACRFTLTQVDTADVNRGFLSLADVTLKTKRNQKATPVSRLTQDQTVLASQQWCFAIARLPLWLHKYFWLCGKSNSPGLFVSTQLPISLAVIRLSCAPTYHSAAHRSPALLPEWTNHSLTHSLKRNVFPS